MYIKGKINNLYIKTNILIVCIFIFLSNIASKEFINNVYPELIKSSFNTFFLLTNNIWLYYIPILAIYLFTLNSFINYDIEKKYIYRFNKKTSLSKYNLIIIFIYTTILTCILNLSFMFISYSINNSKLVFDEIFLIFITIVLQTLVLYIYSLICVLVDLIFYNNKLVLMISESSIFILSLIQGNYLNNSIFSTLSLYDYFTIYNISLKNNNILYTIIFLLLIVYILINFIMMSCKKLKI